MIDNSYQEIVTEDAALLSNTMDLFSDDSSPEFEPTELPARFVDRLRKRDKHTAPYTYRRPHYLKYIEYS